MPRKARNSVANTSAVRQRKSYQAGEGHEAKGRVLGRWEQKDKALRGWVMGMGEDITDGAGEGKALHQPKALTLLT